jgi:hypothetical protein
MSDLNQIANLPRKIKIGEKEYEIKSPSLGVSALIAREMSEVLKLIDFDISKYQASKLDDMVKSILFGIYNAVVGEKSEQMIDRICNILSYLINNSKEEKIITREEIKWGLSINDFLPLLIDVLKAADLSDFLLLLLKMAQAYDIEGIISGSQK